MLRIIYTCYMCDLRPFFFLNDAPSEEGRKWKCSADLDKNALIKIVYWWQREIYNFCISYKIYSSRLWFVFIFFLGKYAEICGLFTSVLTAILNCLQSIRFQCWMKGWAINIVIYRPSNIINFENLKILHSVNFAIHMFSFARKLR